MNRIPQVDGEITMKIKVNYDFIQQELVGKTDVFEIADGTKLGELLLEQELHDGDTIEFVYGFCGG